MHRCLHPARLLAPLVLLTLVAGACSSGGGRPDGPEPAGVPTASESVDGAAAENHRRGGSFRFALGSDPGAIDPRFIADDEGRAVADALFDSLVALDDDLELLPAAAESWEANEDATEFTFTLVDDATFHDGTPVTAQDFVRGLSRIASGVDEPRAYLGYLLAPVVGWDDTQVSGGELEGVEAVDEHTLVFRLEYPFAEFPKVLTHPSLAPIPPVAEADPDEFGDRPVGNGPFQMAEPWQHDQFVRVSRYEDYYGEPALLDEVVFQIYADDPGLEAQYADLEAGQLHFAEVPAARLDQTIEEFGLSDDGYTGPGVLDGLSSTIYYYGFNTAQPPFDDPDVRRAISLLIDRERIAQDITRGVRQPADSVVPPSIPGSQEDACQWCRFDPEQAQELVGERELGPIRILHNTGRTHDAVARTIAGDIEQALDVPVELDAQDLQPFVQEVRGGDVQIFRLGWEAEYPGPGAYLYPLFSSATIGQDNLTRYSNTEVDELLGRARAELDEEARWELYQQVERLVLDDVALAPVMFYEHDRVVAPDVREFVYTAMGTVDLAGVWLDDDA